MAAFFVHVCPHCCRNRQVPIKHLGSRIDCPGCGRSAIAKDPDGQSLAMGDPMKLHAILADIESPGEMARRPR